MAYLHSEREQFRDAIDLAYDQTGVMVQAIEKDYYVTMLLRLLAQKMPYIVFKGGTSLSKCHKVIRRFSEDVDNVLVWCNREGRLRKNARNTGRYLICFFCAIFICRSGLIVVVTINQSLRFFDSYFTFNISRCSSEVS